VEKSVATPVKKVHSKRLFDLSVQKSFSDEVFFRVGYSYVYDKSINIVYFIASFHVFVVIHKIFHKKSAFCGICNSYVDTFQFSILVNQYRFWFLVACRLLCKNFKKKSQNTRFYIDFTKGPNKDFYSRIFVYYKENLKGCYKIYYVNRFSIYQYPILKKPHLKSFFGRCYRTISQNVPF
jgi:hypothetical protein